MKLKAFISAFLVLLFLGMALDSDAQRRNKYKKRSKRNKAISNYTNRGGGRFRPYNFASFNINALNYYGDLAPVNRAASTDVSFTRPGFGVEIGNRFSPYASVRAGFNYGRLKGDDITSDPNLEDSYPRYLRNLSFRNDIKEFHMAFEFFLIPSYGGPNLRPNVNVYLFVGGSVFHHSPKGLVPEFDHTLGGSDSNIPAPRAGDWVNLRKLGTEGQFIDSLDVKKYSSIQVAVPMGIGVKLRLPGPFSAGIELGYRYLFTDYLDDVSTKYVSFDQFDDPLARIMSDRSAEPIAAWSQVDRGVSTASNQLADGITYYAAQGYGGGIDQTNNAIRGNPKDKDMMFITSIKISMILGQVRRSAKFR
ncbi:MAG: DUF6089 family protein [Cyclobacteriaceae bacterium]